MLVLFVLQAFLLVGASENTYFVKSENNSCSSHQYPCLTLEKYASNQSEFFTSDSTFLFKSGTHITKSVLILVSILNLQLKGLDPNPDSCQTDFTIECRNVVNLTLQGLTMTYTGGEA